MNFNDLKDKWMNFINKMNKLGIPVPMARDPRSGSGSITASLVIFSAGLFGLCIIFMLATAVTKWAGMFILTDAALSQVKMAADYSFQFLLAALGGYLGRYMQKGDSVVKPLADELQKQQDKLSAQKVESPD